MISALSERPEGFATLRSRYLAEGYVVIRQLLTEPEVKLLCLEADRVSAAKEIIQTHNLRCRWNPHIRDGHLLLDSLDPVTDLSLVIAAVSSHARLISILEVLLMDSPYLFKDKLLYKPPGAPGYALHQDYIAWPLFPKTFTTALIALDPSTAENGCLEVYPASHKQGCLSALDGDYHDLAEALFAPQEKLKILLDPGDAVIFGCFLAHMSAPNFSNHPRRHLYLSYNGKRDGGEQRQKHYAQFQSWLIRRYNEYGYQNGYFR